MITFLIVCAIIAGALVWRICLVGTYRIEWRAGEQRYEVWQRTFDGYNDLIGFAKTEEEARDLAARAEKNPSRTIR